MAAVSISHMIWFIVAIIVATSTALVFVGVIDNISEGMEDIGDDSVGSMRTSVRIINDPAAVPYNTTSSEITFYLKNSGEYDIQISSILLVVNGTALNSSSLNVDIIVNGPEFEYGSVAEVKGAVPNLEEGRDYHAWVSVNGLSPGGYVAGSAEEENHFRIKAM
jgi:archaellum component FlaG (FlaF/FlaG flagellin family)